MKPFRIVVIEDQSAELEKLSNALLLWKQQSTIAYSMEAFSSGELYLEQEDTEDFPDLFFLDIQLPGMDGLAVARHLREVGYRGYIIFLTAFREYVFEGYNVHAFQFLLKPVNPDALCTCMNEIIKELSEASYIFQDKQNTIQIPYREILTFSSRLHYVDILTADNLFCQYTTLGKIMDDLPDHFIRCHRSHIINMQHIYKISGSSIYLSNNTHIAIGRSYLDMTRNAFLKYSKRLA